MGCVKQGRWIVVIMLLAVHFVFFVYASPCTAQDYIVEFVEEYYNESPADYNAPPVIYHSIQVLSHAGPKLLILKGAYGPYRHWLRRYIARGKQFVATIPDADNHRFISSKVYEIDVIQVHPMNRDEWKFVEDFQPRALPLLPESSYVMILDEDYKRQRLIASVVEKMGYVPMAMSNSDNALACFLNQPEKFSMIIANHHAPGKGVEYFVERVLRVDQQIPILVETGYQNASVERAFAGRFSGASSVILKSMALEDLRNTMSILLGKKKGGEKVADRGNSANGNA